MPNDISGPRRKLLPARERESKGEQTLRSREKGEGGSREEIQRADQQLTCLASSALMVSTEMLPNR